MSAPRGNREFRGSPRGRGQAHPSYRGKPTLLHRGQSSGNSGAGSSILMNEGTSGGVGRPIADIGQPLYGAPPMSAFGVPAYGAPPSFNRLTYEAAPAVQGSTSAFAPEIQMQQHPYPQFVNATIAQPEMPHALAVQYAHRLGSTFPSSSNLQHRAQQQYYQMREQQVRNEPKFCVEPLSKISSTLKKIICFTPQKKLAALVETNDEDEINKARIELLEDLREYDGRSNVPISLCSMSYLKKRKIEYLEIPHAQFPWAPYYCSLCDFHISDLFAADAHLSTHMKEEKRLEERRTLPERLPPLTCSQLSAIERVLVEAAVKECRPDREAKLRDTAQCAMDSVKKLCRLSQFNEAQDIHLSLHGSLVSGLLRDSSDINISLRVDGENTKYFVDVIFTAMEKASDWSEIKLNESPTGLARLDAVFNNEKISIDWQNDEGVRISQLLSLYNRLHEDVLPLRQIVRKWAEKCDLVTAEKLPSQHAVPPVLLDVMLIHALQQSKRLPSIHEIRKCSGKDILDQDVMDVITTMPTLSTRWNLAELFLEFLLYFSKGDVKQFLIQITSTDRISKTDTKFNKKHLNVIDPVRDRPIASLHKAFQCYFINCFLTTYVHFRIPRIKDANGIVAKALVNVEVYQTALQSPLKKKSGKGGKKEDPKEEEQSEASTVLESVIPNQQAVETSQNDSDEVDEATGVYSTKASSPIQRSISPSTTCLISKAEQLDDCPSFLTSLLDHSLPVSIADSSELPHRLTPILIHGKLLEDMVQEDFEIDGNQIYSRQMLMRIKDAGEHRLSQETWKEVRKQGLHTSAPDSNFETPIGTPLNTPSSSTSTKKKRTKKINKSDQLSEDREEKISVTEDSAEDNVQHDTLPIGRCTTLALDIASAKDEAFASSVPLPTLAASNTAPKPAKRVLKLIKLNSAESSELSCEPSPTEEDQLDKIGRLSITSPELKNFPPIFSSGEGCSSTHVSNVSDAMKTEEKPQTICKDVDCSEEIVLPESPSSGLHPTFEELYIDLKEYDLNEVTLSLENLCEEDYNYSFESISLTAGFKCDQHCSACDSPKHLVTECPQLKVPPIREISRAHWRAHFSGELDRIICTIFDNEKISLTRRNELQQVMNRLREAIRKRLNAEFRLDAFGSSENGFGSNRSDFDVCFRYSESKIERNTDMQMQAIMNIEHALRYARFSRVMSITTAKVPIVKFATRVESGEIEGDISYYNELALHNTQLLKRYCSWTKDEMLSKLGMFIKRWAKNCDIGDASKGSLSSYAYIILVIHFLQRLQPHPLLPVLQEMGEKRIIQVDGWDVYFCDDEPKPSWSQCTLSVGELFLQFLEYFAKFDWHNQVVQIRQINKLTKIERGWRKLMCIEDPFDLDHNLGSGISNRMFAFIMKSFVTSREVFFTLKERNIFLRTHKGASAEDLSDIIIADIYISQYGKALLTKCRDSIGGAPRDRQCFKCGRIGHFSDACPTANSGFARRGGGRGGGSGAPGRDDRGGPKREDHKYRDSRKERLMMQRESYRTANEK